MWGFLQKESWGTWRTNFWIRLDPFDTPENLWRRSPTLYNKGVKTRPFNLSDKPFFGMKQISQQWILNNIPFHSFSSPLISFYRLILLILWGGHTTRVTRPWIKPKGICQSSLSRSVTHMGQALKEYHLHHLRSKSMKLCVVEVWKQWTYRAKGSWV